jgi:hypothetical protein
MGVDPIGCGPRARHRNIVRRQCLPVIRRRLCERPPRRDGVRAAARVSAGLPDDRPRLRFSIQCTEIASGSILSPMRIAQTPSI